MFEVEVKVPAPHDRVRDRLDELGADSTGRVDQLDTYYAHPVRSFAETDEALRLRREGERAELTYKGPKVDKASKTRREIETSVGDLDRTAAILREVDFEPVAEVRKSRERYRVDEYVISLDSVEGLGEFVEVETAGVEADIETLRDGVHGMLDQLGLEADNQLRASYLELLADVQE